ncbi:MAG: hypothetical protein ACT4TC_21300, partial [Myxococcaceae bacterium]
TEICTQLNLRFNDLRAEPAAGSRLSLTQRIPFGGSTVNALRVDASFATQYVPGGWFHEGGARVRLELAAGREQSFGVRTGPRLGARWTLDSRTGETRTSATAEWAVELL